MTGRNEDLVQYRLRRSFETLEDAQILAKAERWNACVNRLYYACFYAVTALLSQVGLYSSKHSGVRSLFNLHFVKTDIVQKSYATTYNDLFEQRQESDYVDFVSFESSQIRPLIPKAKSFVELIANIVDKNRK